MAKSNSSVATHQSKPGDKPVIREIRPAPISAPAIATDQPSSTNPLPPLLPTSHPPIPQPSAPPPQPLLFEVGWEVCWQLGGIYTVLRSKAAAMIKKWEDRYYLIGPYNPNTAAL